MPYLIRGNAQQIFSAFGYPELISEANAIKTLNVDIPRSNFFGTEIQANQHIKFWRQDTVANHYAQGNISAGILKCLLGPEPLKKEEEPSEELKQNTIFQHFAYLNDHQEPCGLMLIYRRDEPSQWMIGFIRNTHANPNDREVILLSSFNPSNYIKQPLAVVETPFLNNQLMQALDSVSVFELLNAAFSGSNGDINTRVERINLLMRHFHLTTEGVVLKDPINLAELNLPQLFAENQALDRLVKHSVWQDILSFAMLKDCLSENSGLRHELECIQFTDNPQVNANLLKMVVVFYEAKILENNRELLEEHEFIRLFGGMMWSKVQIKLIPFMRSKSYSEDCMRFILAQDAYYNAVSRLAEMGLTQDVLLCLANPQKLKELEFIHALENEDCKRLCLIFWVKGNLTLDGYQQIVAATKQYPLMAAALIKMDKDGTVIDETDGPVIDKTDGLRHLALHPKKHLEASIIHHFFPTKDEDYLGKYNLNVTDLEAASKALNVLREAGIESKEQKYHLVLGSEKKGKLLRIFLPQIGAIKDIASRNKLIEVLYEDVTSLTPIQSHPVFAVKNKERRNEVNDLRERFICVLQMHDLRFTDGVLPWTAQQNDQRAQCLRQIILRVEAQCKIISERLAGSDREMHKQWQLAENVYRKDIYDIAYEALRKSTTLQEAKKNMNKIEKRMLTIIDPPANSYIYTALVVLANIVITALSWGLANYIKERKTGNYWFFTQSTSGEEIRALDKFIVNLIEKEDDEQNEALPYKPILCS